MQRAPDELNAPFTSARPTLPEGATVIATVTLSPGKSPACLPHARTRASTFRRPARRAFALRWLGSDSVGAGVTAGSGSAIGAGAAAAGGIATGGIATAGAAGAALGGDAAGAGAGAGSTVDARASTASSRGVVTSSGQAS